MSKGTSDWGLGFGRLLMTPHLEHAGVAGGVRDGQRPQDLHSRRVHGTLERDELKLRAAHRFAQQRGCTAAFMVCLAYASGRLSSKCYVYGKLASFKARTRAASPTPGRRHTGLPQ